MGKERDLTRVKVEANYDERRIEGEIFKEEMTNGIQGAGHKAQEVHADGAQCKIVKRSGMTRAQGLRLLLFLTAQLKSNTSGRRVNDISAGSYVQNGRW